MKHRSRRIATMLVAAAFSAALLGACGGSGSESAAAAKEQKLAAQDNELVAQYKKLAAQDKLVATSSRIAAQNRARLVAALRQRWQERQAAGQRAAGSRTVAVRSSGLGTDICAPLGHAGRGKAQRHARQLLEVRRKQALYYLNLSCPAS